MRYRNAGIALVALLGLSGATRALLLDRKPATHVRGPIAVPNPGAAPPVEWASGTVRHLVSYAAPERVVVDSILPDRPARLLWFAGRPAAALGEGVVTTDGTGGVLRVDAALRPHWVPIHAEGREIVSVAPALHGGWWLASGAGEILRADQTGRLLPVAARVPFQYPEVTAGGDAGVWVARSPDRFGFGWYPAGAPPALLHLREDGGVADSLGNAVVPAHALLTDLANTGRLAVSGDTVWYAPFIRDEIIAFDRRGDTLWVASRGLSWAGRAPRFELNGSKPVLDYARVNTGMALGPDGRLYVLSAGDLVASASRLDVYDPTTGQLQRSADLDAPRPTLAADADGRVYLLDPARLLTGAARRERPEFPDVELDRLGGGRMALSDLRGTVTLVNFWASWCAPCRTEMPALDSLRRRLGDHDFAFVAIDEDVRPADGEKFMAEFRFDFPVLLGHGRMQARFHYPGLPYTVLLDRDGRIIQRWFGYAGPQQIDAIRAAVSTELAR